MKKGLVKDAMRLFIITIIAGFCLGAVYFITKDPIEAQSMKKQQEAYKAVFLDKDGDALADSFEPIEKSEYSEENIKETFAGLLEENGLDASVDGLVIAKKNGKPVGAVVTVTDHAGYSGDIKFSVGVNTDSSIAGISLLSIDETPGLGMKAKSDPAFLEQYKGEAVDEFSVVKDGSGSSDPAKIDAIGGATITTNAVTQGANAAILVVNYLQEQGLLGNGGGN